MGYVVALIFLSIIAIAAIIVFRSVSSRRGHADESITAEKVEKGPHEEYVEAHLHREDLDDERARTSNGPPSDSR